ncbi:hypothetical protein INT44_008959 [Umbelopsis vinacea]|uniref:Transposase n=1 Tax=Umbelopsis vinacea TaxID=44442 RepID=A0A8H7Q123_9FUNG|nr:hypothetical protein INT44_008959 [Umbelopsis vinacea]
MTIWGVDIGINDVFVAADGIAEEPHRYRKLSSKEYYHLSIVEPFDRNLRSKRLAFSTYRNKKRGIHEVCRRLTFGSKKYGRQCLPRHPHNSDQSAIRRDFWTPILLVDFLAEDNLQQYMIAFGKTSFGNMRDKKPGPVKTIFRHLCYLSRMKSNIFVVAMDEYLTSQICANCDRRTLKNVRESRNFDSKVWNRDQMASKNIKYIFEYMATHNNERPQQFRRPAGEPPPHNVEK